MDDLRKQVKLIKALQGISYKELAEYIELPPKSFYSWLNGYYEFSYARQRRLKEILSILYTEV